MRIVKAQKAHKMLPTNIGSKKHSSTYLKPNRISCEEAIRVFSATFDSFRNQNTFAKQQKMFFSFFFSLFILFESKIM